MFKKISSALIIAAAFTATPSLADNSYTYNGYHGAQAQVNTSWSDNSASRSINYTGVNGRTVDYNATCAQGFGCTRDYNQTRSNGKSASSSTSCSQGGGCSRDWSATTRNGNTASGSASAKRGSGASRTGTGFRGRKW